MVWNPNFRANLLGDPTYGRMAFWCAIREANLEPGRQTMYTSVARFPERQKDAEME